MKRKFFFLLPLLLTLFNAELIFAATTRYVSTGGSGSTCSMALPCTLAQALSLMAGDDITLMNDGHYTLASGMFVPPTNRSGLAGHLITLKAINEGQVWIDGGFARAPFDMENNDYWDVEGINFSNSSGCGATLHNTDHSIFKRINVWNANPPPPVGTGDNCHSILVWDSANNVFEDVAGFGYGRNNWNEFGPIAGTNICRRCWFRWTGWGPDAAGNTYGGPTMQNAYHSDQSSLYENIILTYTAEQQGPWNPPAFPFRGPDQATFLARDGAQGNGTSQPPVGDTYKGLITYASSGTLYELPSYPDAYFLSWRWAKKTLVDITIDTTGQPQSGTAWIACDLDDGSQNSTGSNCATSLVDRLTVHRTTGQAGKSAIVSHANHTNITECVGAGCPDFYTGVGSSNGARNCFQYVNGTLTSTPLWPWPMDDRIKAALATGGFVALTGSAGSGYAANTVTSEIVAKYGAIPSACNGAAAVGPPATYYVNKTGGLDTNSCMLAQTSGTAKASITAGIGCLTPGSTLIIGDGVYVESINNTVPSGSSGAPTVIQAANRNQAILRPTTLAAGTVVIVSGKDYLTFDGLNLDCVNGGTDCQPFYVSNTATSSHINFINGTARDGSGSFGSGIEYRTVHDSLIQNCDSFSNGNAATAHGIYLSDATSTAITIDGCRVHGNFGYGIDLGNGAHDNIIRNNVTYAQQTGPGLADTSGSNNLFYNNIAYSNLTSNGDGIRIGAGTSDKVLNNTLWSNAGFCVKNAGTSVTIQNNICYQNTSGAISDTGTSTVCGSNLNATGCGAASGNPLFVSTSMADFHLLSGSAAAGVGTSQTAFTTDRDGVTRTTWDAGAYVYAGAVCTPHHLVFTLQPNNALVGASIGTLTISVLDSAGNACSMDTSTITLSKHAGSCTGMTLNGTLSGPNIFSTLSVNMTGAAGSCSLDATDGALIAATSNTFTVSIPASRGTTAIRQR